MRIIIEGKENGAAKNYRYDLFDRYDHATNTSSMQRTTGYTATAVANLLLDDLYHEKGISPPEYIGKTAGAVSIHHQLPQSTQRHLPLHGELKSELHAAQHAERNCIWFVQVIEPPHGINAKYLENIFDARFLLLHKAWRMEQ